MDLVQVYTAVVGLALMAGTAITTVGCFKVRPGRKPLYLMRILLGSSLSATFVLGYLMRFAHLPLPSNLFNSVFYLSFVAAASVLITEPIVDRYEAQTLSKALSRKDAS